MDPKDAIRQTLNMADMIVGAYVNDLDDEAIRLRPIDGMNPIGWQLGHLLSSERRMIEGIKPGASPALPDGFDQAHSPDSAKANNFGGLKGKDDYIRLRKAQREATTAVLDGLAGADLAAPAPEAFRQFAPTVGALLNMVGIHDLMHAGQFVAVRRKLGKPVAI